VCSRQAPPAAIEPISSRNCCYFLPGPLSPLLVQDFVVGAWRRPARSASASWIDERCAQLPRASTVPWLTLSDNARHHLWCLPFVYRTEHFTRYNQGVSHAKWPKDNYEWAPIQTDTAICCTLEAVDTECRPPRFDGLSKRAKKLRAVSDARSRRGSNRRHGRGRELLPVRRTLF
jgi:hypothetical protein